MGAVQAVNIWMKKLPSLSLFPGHSHRPEKGFAKSLSPTWRRLAHSLSLIQGRL